MKKDIAFDPVTGVMVAIVPDETVVTTEGQPGWLVYLINDNDFPLENVIVSSNGYGTNAEGEAIRTSTLRHVLPEVQPCAAVPIEPIDPALFHLNNQYWVSYYVDKQVFDKKFIFVPDSIVAENLTPIVLLLGKPGILHN